MLVRNRSLRWPLLALLLLALCGGTTLPHAYAADTPPRLVRDLFPAPASLLGYASQLTSVGQAAFFVGGDAAHGTELWRTDGTAAGTTLVRELVPGAGSLGIANLTAMGSQLFFSASTASSDDLWVSDGTAAGTRLVVPSEALRPRYIEELVVVGDTLFFSAGNAAFERELWRTDGTAAGTQIVRPTTDGSALRPYNLTVVGDQVFFLRTDSTSWRDELWASDGSAAGTRRISMFPDMVSGRPKVIGLAGTTLLLLVDDPTLGYDLWASDGTTAGTQPLRELAPGTARVEIYDAVSVGTRLFLSTDNSPEGKLWVTDGTTAGTQPIAIATSVPLQLTAFGDLVVFTASDAASGGELWRSDGTLVGTTRIADLVPGPNNSAPSDMLALGSSLFFLTRGVAATTMLWRSDGTEAGTVFVRDLSDTWLPWPGGLMAFGTQLLFLLQNATTSDLWRSDGTTLGTQPLRIQAPTGRDSSPTGLLATTEALYFTADSADQADGLWRSDGTAAGTTRRADTFVAYGRSLASAGSKIFYVTYGASGQELWATDAALGPATALVPLDDGDQNIFDHELTAAGQQLFFLREHAPSQHSLWVTDGTPAGTRMVYDLGAFVSYPPAAELTAVGDTLYFVADDGVHGRELWRSDGTAAGTRMVRDINADGGGAPLQLTASDGRLFFFAYPDSSSHRALYVSDGTAAGTIRLTTQAAGHACVNFGGIWETCPPITSAAGRVFFVGQTAEAQVLSLWTSDGTPGGTTAFAPDLPLPGADARAPLTFMAAALGEQILIVGALPDGGRALWVSDGTAAGTRRVGPALRAITEMVSANGRVFFAAADLSAGEEIWVTDGTDAGTRLAMDLVPGAGGSSPAELTVRGDELFFSAFTAATGRELWALPVGVRMTSAPAAAQGQVGVPYQHTFTARGAAAPQFQVVAGTLPPGLSLSAAGVLSGTPTRAGVYPDIQIQAAGQGDPATERLTLTIAPAGAALVLTNASGQTVAPGSTVALRGQSFTPGARVALALDGRMLGSLLVASDGSFTATLSFPTSAPERSYTLTATELAASETMAETAAATQVGLTITLARGAALVTAPATGAPQFQALPTLYLPLVRR